MFQTERRRSLPLSHSCSLDYTVLSSQSYSPETGDQRTARAPRGLRSTEVRVSTLVFFYIICSDEANLTPTTRIRSRQTRLVGARLLFRPNVGQIGPVPSQILPSFKVPDNLPSATFSRTGCVLTRRSPQDIGYIIGSGVG